MILSDLSNCFHCGAYETHSLYGTEFIATITEDKDKAGCNFSHKSKSESSSDNGLYP
ncbi:hypothetical protein IKO50_05215 [bacterium]|nr:hypothetical protein [bacterium]